MATALDTLLARTGFNVADQDDVDGLALDGDDQPTKAVGSFEKHPASDNTIAVRSSHAEPLGLFDVSKYTIADVTGLIGAQHATEAVLRFPNFDTFTPASPCHSGDCAGENPDRCGYPDILTPVDWYTIWWQRPTLGDVAHLSVQATLSNGTYVKGEVDVNADGSGAFYVTITPAGGDTATVGPHSLRPDFALEDFCNFITISIDEGGLLTVAGPGNSISVGTFATSLGTPSHSVTGVTLNAFGGLGSGFDPGDENTEMEVCVRADPTADTKYNLRFAFNHTATDPDGTLYLFETVAGVERLLHEAVGGLPVFHDTPAAVKLGVTHENILTGSWAGVERLTFDLINDTAWEDDEPATMIASGRPGITATGPLTAGWQAIEQVSVYGCDPSGGGGGGGGGGTPGTLQHVMQNLALRGFTVPDQVKAQQNIGMRQVVVGAWIMENKSLRSLVTEEPDTHGDQPEDPPDIGCVEIPDLVPGTPPEPFTGDRIYSCSDLPLSLINTTVFTCSGRALGPWTPGELAQAAALGGSLLTGQGGYGKFLTGGAYDPDKMDAWIATHAAYETELHDAYTAGTWKGQSIADDFDSKILWPPDGLNDAELIRIAGVWRAMFSWAFLWIRGKPSQFGVNITNLDGCIAAYHETLGSPSGFISTELSAAAGLTISKIVWGINITKGGRGLVPLSLALTEEAGLAMAADTSPYNAGIQFWKYTPSVLTRPGEQDVLVEIRNALGLLP